MKRLRNHLVGVDQGDVVLFEHFQNGGAMWTGEGPRKIAKAIAFSETFAAPPTVHVALSLWDMDSATNVRADVTAHKITEAGFEALFRTWGDTRIARVRLTWLAIGQMPDEELWDLS